MNQRALDPLKTMNAKEFRAKKREERERVDESKNRAAKDIQIKNFVS